MLYKRLMILWLSSLWVEVCGEGAGKHAPAGGGEENLSWKKKDVFVCPILAGDISAAQFSVTGYYVILVASMTMT